MLVRVELTLPRDASFVTVMRNLANSLLVDLQVPSHAISDVQVAVSEACANVVRHAEGAFDYSVSLAIGPEGCEIEVADLGPGFATTAPGAGTDVDAEDGRGLLLMRALMDDLEFIRRDETTRVRLTKHWDAVPEFAPLSST